MMASSPQDDDSLRRTRIISHMNQSHSRELSHYLQHYARLSPRAASGPLLRDLSLDHMLIYTRAGTRHSIPFSPPLTSWADAKTRIIHMDTVARANLGISNIYISHFEKPRGIGLVFFIAVAFFLLTSFSTPWIVPGTRAWSILEAYFPGGPAVFCQLHGLLIVPVIGIHITECFFFDRKLRRHGIERWSGLWYLWISSCFMEGVGAFWRLDSIIASKKAQQEEAKKSAS
ncbi:hypothetical protein CDD82_2088 [Ophiocordyceps australis]|uniref:DUF2470 domain-containing protein n=1 Tax=Ophiocordyceps australis TaxID=1399860 RepID=A0A2C5ZTK8_9HYPO|nr:hypothetical protein CDD82_2088 [Ophiocordyceps australis]